MIVARGLGRGVGAVLVTAGLGLTVAIIPPAPAPGGFGDGFRIQMPNRPHNQADRQRQDEAMVLAIAAAFLQMVNSP